MLETLLETLLKIILFVFDVEVITEPYFLPSILPIYFIGLIAFNKAYCKNKSKYKFWAWKNKRNRKLLRNIKKNRKRLKSRIKDTNW